MTPIAIIADILTGTGIKVVTTIVVGLFFIWVFYSLYESTLRVKELKQKIVLNEIELIGKTV